MKTKSIIDRAFDGAGFTYKVLSKHKSTCPFCDYPQWVIEVRNSHEWSDGVIEHDVIKLQLHNFIELGYIISIKSTKRAGLSLGMFRKLERLQTNLINEFNK